MAKLLFVDDEPALRLLYYDEFSEEGYDVVTAANCSEAAKFLEKDDIDLAILDIQIKQESGLDMLQRIVKQHKELPIILCSAYNCYKDDFSSWLADAYVIKSSDMTELKHEVSHQLQRSA